MAKVLSGVSMGIVGMLSMVIVAAILFKVQVLMIAGILLTGFTAILFTSFAGIFIDLYNPKLNWDNEQKAVKQNMNLLYNMALCVAIGGLTIFAAFKFKMNFVQTFVIIIILFGLLDTLLYYLLTTKGVERFNKIEG